jgi:hypothetical protein
MYLVEVGMGFHLIPYLCFVFQNSCFANHNFAYLIDWYLMKITLEFED